MSRTGNHSPVIVRDARLEDLGAARGVLHDAYAEYREHFPPTMWEAYRQEIADVESRSGAAELVIAARANAVVGTVTFYASGALDRHGWPASFSAFRLLAVAPAVRRLGLGRQLVQHCIDRALRTGAEALGLHSAPFMTAAIALYERMGFVRAPAYDFAAENFYGTADGSAHVAGLAYVLPIQPTLRIVAEETDEID